MIYLDNAATTLQKPHSVISQMNECMKHYCANSGRGGHKLTMLMGEKIYECREKLAKLFGVESPTSIVFTNNTTAALNIAIKGLVDKNSHVVISGMEHNSVLRPVVSCAGSYTIAKADKTGFVSAKSIEDCVKENTALIVVTHASNVAGTINPIKQIGEFAKKNNIPFLVDAAQTAGVIDIDVKRDNISLLAFAGHKMLYGPTGTGGLYVAPNIKLRTIIEGGTGTMSASFTQPDFMPDMLESGTLNTVGIVGLSKGVDFINKTTIKAIREKEVLLTGRLIDGLSNMDFVKVYGGQNRVGVVSFLIDEMDSVEISQRLDNEFGIATRGGLHCAVLAHQTLGTQSTGLTRFSISEFTTKQNIDYAIKCVSKFKK